MRRLYIIPKRDELEKSLEIVNKYNAYFEYDDFFWPDVISNDEKIDEIINTYLALNRDTSNDILHGAFFDITIHSYDKEIVAISDKRIRKSIKIAQRLGVKKLVFHTNIIPNFYSKYYINRTK